VAAAIAGGGVDKIAEKAQAIVQRGLQERGPEIVSLSMASTAVALQRTTRLVALQHRLIDGADTTPLITSPPTDPASEIGDVRGDVVRVVLSALPQPDDSTPWERIVEFRADAEAQLALRRLRRWMNQIGGKATSAREVEQELQHIYDSYTEYMRLHEMKISRGRFESFVTVTADVLQDLAHLRFGDVARAVFSLTKKNIALAEAELSAPGREVAYVVKAHLSFDSGGDP
jgi:hypothetical protein